MAVGQSRQGVADDEDHSVPLVPLEPGSQRLVWSQSAGGQVADGQGELVLSGCGIAGLSSTCRQRGLAQSFATNAASTRTVASSPDGVHALTGLLLAD